VPVTKLFTVNFDTAYRLPITSRRAKWPVYMGGGPSRGFTHQNFDRAESGVDFGDLDFAGGLNLFTGIETRKGFFAIRRRPSMRVPIPHAGSCSATRSEEQKARATHQETSNGTRVHGRDRRTETAE
jgi:hypothetical protein